MITICLPVSVAALLLGFKGAPLAATAVMPVLGHAAGVFNRFHGGKCISVSFGAMAGLLSESPVMLMLCASYLLFSVILKVKPNGLSSILSYSAAGVLGIIKCLSENEPYIAAAVAVICITVILKHAAGLKEELTRNRETR